MCSRVDGGVVLSAAAVEAVIAAGGLGPGCVVVDSTSGEPAASKKIAERLEKLGCHYLDAPVSGGPGGAKAASLTCMLGGQKEAVHIATGYIQAWAKKVVVAGPS